MNLINKNKKLVNDSALFSALKELSNLLQKTKNNIITAKIKLDNETKNFILEELKILQNSIE